MGKSTSARLQAQRRRAQRLQHAGSTLGGAVVMTILAVGVASFGLGWGAAVVTGSPPPEARFQLVAVLGWAASCSGLGWSLLFLPAALAMCGGQ